jgi:UrcA family protein
MFSKELGRAVAVSGACAALALFAAPADAQLSPTGAGDKSAYGVGDITVYAHHRYATQPTTGERVRMDSISMTVPLDDLDLATRRGARIAKARIERAARDVCDEVQLNYPKDVEPAVGSCYTHAVRDAVAQAQDVAGYPILAWGYR